MNRIQQVQARCTEALRTHEERPTIPAPAYAACRAAAMRAQIAHELLVEDRLAVLAAVNSERPTVPAPASELDWDIEVEA